MALPISGAWRNNNANANQYVGALKWGTGINAVHSFYGEGPPVRRYGRIEGPDYPTPGLSDIPETFEDPDMYGYCMEDIATMGRYSGMIPPVGTETGDIRYEIYPPGSRNMGYADDQPDWGVKPYDPEMTAYRLETGNPHSDPAIWSGTRLKSFPTETVTEGWRNKETGAVEDANTSAVAQYERQTSMQQVDPPAGRNNDLAVARATDDPRFNIMTRLTGQKIKPWSEGQRNEDMFPYQQDTIIRPFHYRTAGTDNPGKMAPNEMFVNSPVQRDVPPDPWLGPDETSVGADGYGYTGEDVIY
jgi:hypothetical protein